MRCLRVETSLALLVTTDLEVLAALDGVHAHSLAGVALEAEHNLLGGLSLWKHERRGFGQRLGVLPGRTGDTARLEVGTPGPRLGQGARSRVSRRVRPSLGRRDPRVRPPKPTLEKTCRDFPGHDTHLLVEHGLGLTTETALLAVVTPLTCGIERVEGQ